MDLPPPVQDPEPRTGGPDDALTRRIDAVEARLVALGARLEQMEATLQQAVRDEGHTVSTEIRYTLSELGRRLALDLPQTLDKHRQMIVADLRPAGTEPITGQGQDQDEALGADRAADGQAAVPGAAPTAEGGSSPAGPGAAADGAEPGEGGEGGPGQAGSSAEADDEADDSPSSGGRRKRRRRRGD